MWTWCRRTGRSRTRPGSNSGPTFNAQVARPIGARPGQRLATVFDHSSGGQSKRSRQKSRRAIQTMIAIGRTTTKISLSATIVNRPTAMITRSGIPRIATVNSGRRAKRRSSFDHGRTPGRVSPVPTGAGGSKVSPAAPSSEGGPRTGPKASPEIGNQRGLADIVLVYDIPEQKYEQQYHQQYQQTPRHELGGRPSRGGSARDGGGRARGGGWSHLCARVRYY